MGTQNSLNHLFSPPFYPHNNLKGKVRLSTYDLHKVTQPPSNAELGYLGIQTRS